MAQQSTGAAKSSLDAVTPPIDTAAQQPFHIGLENAISGFKIRAGSRVADPRYITQVAIEVYAHIVEAWKLNDSDARKMLGVGPESWVQIKNGTWSEVLNQEQLMRISAIIGLYKALHSCFSEDLANHWVKRPNTESMFSGRKPIDVMIEEGLPVMIRARDYMGALLGIE